MSSNFWNNAIGIVFGLAVIAFIVYVIVNYVA